jgi:RNA polymerase-associated protein CTR9
MAGERRKYGENMLRKAGEHIAAQQEYEAQSNAKREAARQKRQEESDRRKELEVS